MPQKTVSCTIEHHAILFALLLKYATVQGKEAGQEAIQRGMTRYGRERGARMAQNALEHGDALNTMTFQAYGEWAPEYPGQMDAGQIQIAPTLQTYVTKCAWCDAWNKHHLLEYGKYYCLNVDNAVYQGFNSGFTCRHLGTPLSFGGPRCEFDWGHPLTDEENRFLSDKKAQLGTSCTKDFTYHTAHILYTISHTLLEELGDKGKTAVDAAVKDYVALFGIEYLNALDGIYEGHPIP